MGGARSWLAKGVVIALGLAFSQGWVELCAGISITSPVATLSLCEGGKGVRLASHVFLSQTLSLVQAPELDIEAAAFPIPP